MGRVMLIASVLTFYICVANGQTACLSPNATSGTCKSIKECPSLLAVASKADRTQQDTDFLKQSQCDYKDLPLVCCPDPKPCYTPNGRPGKCVSIYSCPHLSNLAKPPLTQDNIQYLQNSRCAGSEQYSVCCGPPVEDAVVPLGNCAVSVSAFPPDPKTKCCGVDLADTKYLISYETAIDQYPWLVIIEYFKGDQIKLLCGGVLISGRYVLTAAHCVAGDILKIGTAKRVRLAEYDIQNEGMDCKPEAAGGLDCSDGITSIPIEETIPHPAFNTTMKPSPNDIALIRLARNAPYNDFIRPICLPSGDVTTTPEYNTLRTHVAGWGATPTSQPSSNVKLHIDMTTVTNDICEEIYKSSGITDMKLATSQMCAGGIHGKDSCKGDSGGPLMYENGRHFEVIGVNSFGFSSCNTNDSRVFTKVYEYDAWIKNTIRA